MSHLRACLRSWSGCIAIRGRAAAIPGTGGHVIRGRVSFLMASLQRTVRMSGIFHGHVIQARRLRRIASSWPVRMKTKKYPEAITAAILRKIGAIAEA